MVLNKSVNECTTTMSLFALFQTQKLSRDKRLLEIFWNATLTHDLNAKEGILDHTFLGHINLLQEDINGKESG